MKLFSVFIASMIFAVLTASHASAQNQENTLKEYVPPPLFGEPRNAPPKAKKPSEKRGQKPAQVRANDDNSIIPQRISKRVILEKSKPAPIPPRRPASIVSKSVAGVQKEEPQIEETQKPKASAGVVTGPKTMPAVKADSVQVENIGGEEVENEAPATDMLARVQPPKEEGLEVKKDQRPEREPKILDTDKPNIIIFEPGVTDLNNQQKDALEFAVIPTLKKTGARLKVQSFASPATDGFSSDRRVSLSRALAVREFLLEKGFEPSKIQLRALGAETNKQPFDRIELIFEG